MIAPLALWLLAAAPAASAAAAPAKAEPPPRPGSGQKLLEAAIPPYPHTTEPAAPVGDTLEANGVPMNVKSFMTRDTPRQVLDFYEAYFQSKQMPMLGNGDMPLPFKYPSVTALQPDDVELSVIAIPGPDHRTMVLLARADMGPLDRDLKHAEQEKFGGLPPYPKAENPGEATFSDGEVQTVRVDFETADSPAQVEKFYRDAFAKLGASPRSDDGELVADLPDGSWRLGATLDPASKRTVVTAVHRRTGAAHPEEEP